MDKIFEAPQTHQYSNDRGPFHQTASLISHTSPYKFIWDKPSSLSMTAKNFHEFSSNLPEAYIHDWICEKTLLRIVTHFTNLKFIFIKKLMLNESFSVEEAKKWGETPEFSKIKTAAITFGVNLEIIFNLFPNLESFYTIRIIGDVKSNLTMPKLKYLSLYYGNIKMVNKIIAPLEELDIISVDDKANLVGPRLKHFVKKLRISIDFYNYINLNQDFKILQFYYVGKPKEDETLLKVKLEDFIAPYNTFSPSFIDKLYEKYKDDKNFKLGAYITDPYIQNYLKFKNINLYDDNKIIHVRDKNVVCNFFIFDYTILKSFPNHKIYVMKEYKAVNKIGNRVIVLDGETLYAYFTSQVDLVETIQKILKVNSQYQEKKIKTIKLYVSSFSHGLNFTKIFPKHKIELY
jgi:hypothetical protein